MSTGSTERKITVLISGNGTNLQALIDACKDSRIPNTRIVRVLSNRAKAYGLERARTASIPTTYHNLLTYSKKYPSSDPNIKHSDEARRAYDAELANLVLEDQPDLVVCAGFMHILSTNFLDPLVKRKLLVINLHPALPGAFQGAGAIEWAFNAFQKGEIEKTGLMIHYVIEQVDMGQHIVVRDVELKKDETLEQLEKRFHSIEHGAIVEGTKIALGRLGG